MMSHSELTNPEGGRPAVDFMALLGRCLGNFKIVERVLATFRDTGWADLNQLQTSLEASDFQAVIEISHRFKGAASNVSATGLHEFLIQAERLGHEQNSVELMNVLVQLRLEWDIFLRFAQVFAPAADAVSHDPVKQTEKPWERQHAGAGC